MGGGGQFYFGFEPVNQAVYKDTIARCKIVHRPGSRDFDKTMIPFHPAQRDSLLRNGLEGKGTCADRFYHHPRR